jgi:pyruvate/2-oxoglutarate dehydrogenase complex dihydrolipoamide dehydrogenase (E3) component
LERYDLVIVGGGATGINALKAAITLPARVALVDRGPLGGTCVNWG